MTTARAGRNEAAVIAALFAQLGKLQRTNSAYFARLEDSNVDIARRADLMDLMVAAPNDKIKFFLLGKLTMRVGLGR